MKMAIPFAATIGRKIPLFTFKHKNIPVTLPQILLTISAFI